MLDIIKSMGVDILKGPRMNPEQRTMDKLKKEGWMFIDQVGGNSRFSHDPFGIADIIAFKSGCQIWVQSTTSGHFKEHVDNLMNGRIKRQGHLYNKKIIDIIRIINSADVRIVVHGWMYSKKTNEWICREQRIR